MTSPVSGVDLQHAGELKGHLAHDHQDDRTVMVRNLRRERVLLVATYAATRHAPTSSGPG
jgi:hypothetical protein